MQVSLLAVLATAATLVAALPEYSPAGDAPHLVSPDTKERAHDGNQVKHY